MEIKEIISVLKEIEGLFPSITAWQLTFTSDGQIIVVIGLTTNTKTEEFKRKSSKLLKIFNCAGSLADVADNAISIYLPRNITITKLIALIASLAALAIPVS